jgi:hypothetical protein
MRTVISHFWNEELLLPHWLNHHKEIFDFGILINRGSTDLSVDICRDIVPNWLVVPSRYDAFDSILTDHEVMCCEESVRGFKIVLNTTEFFMHAKPLADIESEMTREGKNNYVGRFSSAAIMVDLDRSMPFSPNMPLPLQKPFGIYETASNRDARIAADLPRVTRGRFYHNFPIGGYEPGRHNSYYSFMTPSPDLLILWFGYSPWTNEFINRKVKIGSTVSSTDKIFNRGYHHTNATVEEQNSRYNKLRSLAKDLSVLPHFRSIRTRFLYNNGGSA